MYYSDVIFYVISSIGPKTLDFDMKLLYGV